jgi:hypothetical protein
MTKGDVAGAGLPVIYVMRQGQRFQMFDAPILGILAHFVKHFAKFTHGNNII